MDFSTIGIDTKGRAGRLSLPCPACGPDRKPENRSKPCLTVDTVEGWWNCNHCTFKGNLRLQEKFEKIRKNSGMPKVVPDLYKPEVMSLLLGIKQISAQTAKFCGLYQIKPLKGEKYGAVAFPYYYQNSLCNVKFRRLEYDITIEVEGNKKYLAKNWQIKKDYGTKITYWGLNWIDFEKSKDLIITEGETDAMTWIEAYELHKFDSTNPEMRWVNVISVPNGAPNAEATNVTDKMEFANDPFIIKNVYSKAERVFIATDNDAPGKRLRDELISIIGKEKCYIVDYNGRKDINEVLAGDSKKGYDPLYKDGVKDCLDKARPCPIKGIIYADDVYDKIVYISENGLDRGMGIEINDIDRLFTLRENGLQIVTGIPSHGKSTFVRWYLYKFNRKNKKKIALFTPENSPPEREFAKLLELYVGKPIKRGFKNSMSEVERRHAVSYIKDNFYIVNPDKDNREVFNDLKSGHELSPKAMRSLQQYFKMLRQSHNVWGYVIDAWNKIDHHKPNNMTEESFISKSLDSMLDFNQDLGMNGTIVAHPVKMPKKKEQPNYEEPTLYDIKGTSGWYERAEIGITIYREKFKKLEMGKEGKKTLWQWQEWHTAPTDVIVNKIKFEGLGQEGRTSLYLDWKNGGHFVKDMPDYYNEENFSNYMRGVEKDDNKPKESTILDDLPF